MAATNGSLTLSRACSLALFAPREAVRAAPVARPLGAGLLGYLLAAFGWALSDFIMHGRTNSAVDLVSHFMVGAILLALLLLSGFVFTHLFASLLGRGHGVQQHFWGMGLSVMPLAMLVPLAIACVTFTEAGRVIYLPGKLGVFLWILGIQVVSLSESYQISVPRALFAFFASYGAALLLLAGLIVFGPLALVGKIALIQSATF